MRVLIIEEELHIHNAYGMLLIKNKQGRMKGNKRLSANQCSLVMVPDLNFNVRPDPGRINRSFFIFPSGIKGRPLRRIGTGNA